MSVTRKPVWLDHPTHEMLRGLAATDHRTMTGTIRLLLAREAAARGLVAR